MLRTYLLSADFSPKAKQALIEFVDTLDHVKNWMAFLPGSILLVTDHDEDAISIEVHTKFPLLAFIVTPVSMNDTNGFLLPGAWDMINYPGPVKE